MEPVCLLAMAFLLFVDRRSKTQPRSADWLYWYNETETSVYLLTLQRPSSGEEGNKCLKYFSTDSSVNAARIKGTYDGWRAMTPAKKVTKINMMSDKVFTQGKDMNSSNGHFLSL